MTTSIHVRRSRPPIMRSLPTSFMLAGTGSANIENWIPLPTPSQGQGARTAMGRFPTPVCLGVPVVSWVFVFYSHDTASPSAGSL